MARLLYTLLLYAGAPAILLRLWWRGRRQAGYRSRIGERFGLYRALPTQATIWLHAVSVGEMRAAEPLVAALRAAFPGHRLVLSCMTPTGRDTAQSLYGAIATIVYAPYDFPGAVARFFDSHQPQIGILLETELWPNLLAAAARRRVPVVLANARLSEKSAAGYARVAGLVRPAIRSLAALAVQSEDDGQRLAALGARNISVCGNLKFDVTPDPARIALGQNWRMQIGRRPVWLAASTRDGEEALILGAFERLAIPDALLVLVPRHPQRFDAVARLVEDRGLAMVRRSQGVPETGTRVWLGDSMGEMPAYYSCADLTLIGGSLLPFGSQNLIEACACGSPVLIGPSDFNFAKASADALAAGAARRIASDPGALAAAVAGLFGDTGQLQAMCNAALEFAGAHRGATARNLRVIQDALAASGVPSPTAATGR